MPATGLNTHFLQLYPRLTKVRKRPFILLNGVQSSVCAAKCNKMNTFEQRLTVFVISILFKSVPLSDNSVFAFPLRTGRNMSFDLARWKLTQTSSLKVYTAVALVPHPSCAHLAPSVPIRLLAEVKSSICSSACHYGIRTQRVARQIRHRVREEEKQRSYRWLEYLICSQKS